MAQGEFTKEEAREVKKAVEEIMNGMSKPKLRIYLGHFNDILLFLGTAEKYAPQTEKE